MVAINRILLPECAGEECGGDSGTRRDSRVHHRNAENRAPVTRNHCLTQPLVNNLYQGMTLDAVTGLYYERFRNYSPTLGTWTSQDPLGYINGADTYQFVNSSPVGNVDPWGETVGVPIPNPAPASWGPINQSTGQPDSLPPLPDGSQWVPVANPRYVPGNPSSRPVKWAPRDPIPGGSQPSGGWDTKEGYGTCGNGNGARAHYDPDGKPLPPDEAQKYRNKIRALKEPEEPGKCPSENAPADDEPFPTIEDIVRLPVRILGEGGADEYIEVIHETP